MHLKKVYEKQVKKIMDELQLSDLRNPHKTVAVLEYKTNKFIERAENQGFQIIGKMVELWAKLTDGRMICLKRWRATSVCQYGEG